jgi:signal transduction histidine kinase
MLTIPKPGHYLARFRNARGHDQVLMRPHLQQGLPSVTNAIFLRDARSYEIACHHSPNHKARSRLNDINETSHDIVDLIYAVRSQFDSNISGTQRTPPIAEAGNPAENVATEKVASGIAHHFNNLFMGIQSNVSLLLQKNDICLSNYKRLKRVEKLVQSESMLTNDLLTHLVKNRPGFSANFHKQMTNEILRLAQRIRASHDVPDCRHKFLVLVHLDPNNPRLLTESITYILGRLLQEIHTIIAVMLKKSHQGRSEFSRLKRIDNYVLSGFEMVEDLLHFANRESRELQQISWHQLVEIALDTYFSIQMPIRINLSVAGNLSAIKANPRLINKILLHLFMNAAEAMPGGGDLFFNVTRVACGDETANSEDPEPGVYMLLTIRDTGHGMAARTLARAFDPFFTSKAPSLGRGLGLSCSLGIVKTLGGKIKAFSNHGQGTTIKIYLPAYDTEKGVSSRKELNRGASGFNKIVNISRDEQRLA